VDVSFCVAFTKEKISLLRFSGIGVGRSKQLDPVHNILQRCESGAPGLVPLKEQ